MPTDGHLPALAGDLRWQQNSIGPNATSQWPNLSPPSQSDYRVCDNICRVTRLTQDSTGTAGPDEPLPLRARHLHVELKGISVLVAGSPNQRRGSGPLHGSVLVAGDSCVIADLAEILLHRLDIDTLDPGASSGGSMS